MSNAADSHPEAAGPAANDGYVAGTYFARWNLTQDVRTLVHVILGGPVEKQVQDFYYGFMPTPRPNSSVVKSLSAMTSPWTV